MPTFVTPLMLAGAALIAVPIVLHLLRWQQPKHLEFPALRFIRQRREANRRRLRLRHLLLLLLRACAIALLAAALARPIFQSAGFFSNDTPVAAALVFETGPRMAYTVKNQTRLDVARSLGRTLLAQLPSGSSIAVFDSQHPRNDFDLDREVAGSRIDQLAVASSAQPLISVFDHAISVLNRGGPPRKEIYLFTDLARSDWGDEQTAQWQKRLRENPTMAMHVIDVGVPQPENFGLGEIELSNQVVSQNGSLQIHCELQCEGPAGQRVVRLYLVGPDGRPQLKDERSFSCQADSATQMTFEIGALPLGTHQGYLEIAAEDALPIDNRRYFTVRIAAPWRVLIAAPPPVATKALLLTQLLAPTSIKRQGRAEFDCEVIQYGALATAELKHYDAIWLLDPSPLPDPIWQRVADYANEGHGVAVVLGGGAGPTGDGLNGGAAQAVLPGKLKLLINTGGADLYLAPDRLEHPVFDLLKQLQGTIPWDRNPIFKYWDLDPLHDSAQVLLRYGDSRPALIEQRIGRGRTLTLTTSLTESTRRPWNLLLLPQQESYAGFALVLGMAEYLVGRVDERTNYSINDVAELRLGADELFDSYLLSTPLGDTVKVSQQDGVIHFDDTKVVGQYQLRAGGETDVRRGFSVNLDPAATQLTRLDDTSFQEAFAKTPLQLARSSEEVVRQRRAGEAKSQWELYPWLMLAVALVLVGENLLSSLFYRRTADAARAK